MTAEHVEQREGNTDTNTEQINLITRVVEIKTTSAAIYRTNSALVITHIFNG
jgi:hypothetical protein